MRNPDRCRLSNSRARNRSVFDLDRADPFAARLDNVLGAVGDLDRTIGMDRRHVAGIEPIVAIDAVMVVLEVALDDRGPASLQLTGTHSVTWQHHALRI